MSYLNKKLGALRKMTRYCTVEQLILLANGMMLSNITYCISSWIDCTQRLKDKVQAIITEMYRVIFNDRTSSVKDLHSRCSALNLTGWAEYLDFMLGKSFNDFTKPTDMTRRIGGYQSGRQKKHQTTNTRQDPVNFSQHLQLHSTVEVVYPEVHPPSQPDPP